MSQSFPRFNTKCSRENELLCRIFWVVFRLPLHFVLYCTYLRKYWGCGRANYVSVEGTVRISKRTRQMSSELFDTFHSIIVYRAHWVSLDWLYSLHPKKWVTLSSPVLLYLLYKLHSTKGANQRRRHLPFPLRYSNSMLQSFFKGPFNPRSKLLIRKSAAGIPKYYTK